jgi:hypothetical protein
MMRSDSWVGLTQVLVEGDCPQANLDRAVDAIHRAAARGYRLVVLPECLDLGWTDPSARNLAQPIPGPHADRLAQAVTAHATPVGSGTVARTKRIPVQGRAEAVVIAWLRHQTTAYDDMKIARVKGKRREVRRLLAEQSRQLLDVYRRGDHVDAAQCPLQKALSLQAGGDLQADKEQAG